MRAGFLLEILLPVLFIGWATVMFLGATVSATGYRALAQLQSEEATLQRDVEQLSERRVWMENRAALMHSSALDPDMVDERIRGVLGFAQAGDIVISRDDLEAALAILKNGSDSVRAIGSIAILEQVENGEISPACGNCFGLVAAQ